MEFLFSTRLQAEGMQLHKKYAPPQVFSKVLLRFVAIYNEFSTFRKLLFIGTPFSSSC